MRSERQPGRSMGLQQCLMTSLTAATPVQRVFVRSVGIGRKGKWKTHTGCKDRFDVLPSMLVRTRGRSYTAHKMSKKSRRRRQRLRQPLILNRLQSNKILALLGRKSAKRYKVKDGPGTTKKART
ncbi:hypothetical protein FVE85_9001 [Porphyridium purpureum]|uniref:50S ribosomal protein L35 n=1 Tax=Porphyridium purpureum TaxID=35688 RepID=A0A5J4YL85_PORPP|nr:hypothetical protein FVE85_8224 [Porphyridium purpureum]KAA8492729.1 hypothetical protein FVE85_9001 [Porphyridium purpureum]|eukprot:POR9779..scf222_8